VNLEKFLTFVTHHNESIIQWLFFGILLLAGTLIARSLFGKKEENQASGGDLHSALEKILAQTTKLESISVEGLKAGGSPESAALVVALKADLATREKELTELKAKGGSDEATSALSARIKELEAKLAEYEILEDDIADLSLYKEENARLKSELDRVKGGEGAASAPQPEPAAEVEPPKGDDIVAEFAQAVDQKPEPPPEGADKIEIPDTGDPMADFESTVKLEKKLAGEPAAAPAKPAAAEAAPAAPAAGGGAQAEADDLFAEFSAGGEEGGAALDTDKMMAEMAALVSMEPASGNALEESIDTDKMAAEATSFTKS
jgi:hypothetical protein